MHRTFVSIAILAMAAPFIGTAQNYTSTQHANAVAGQAGAAQMEACAKKAGTLIGNLDKGDFTAAAADFNASMAAELDATKLAAIWKQVGEKAGKLEGHGAAQQVIYNGHAIITMPLRFQKTLLNARVACDADGKIAGFFLQPAGADGRN